jgi:CO/xanthine dehydrogenase Mo-binding subunit
VQACFAYEAQMDRLAAALGLDPVELRLRNALAGGDELPTGEVITGSLPVAEVIRRCAALQPPPPEGLERDALRFPGGAGNTSRGEALRRGVGFAVGFKNIAYSEGFDDYAAARVRLTADDGGALLAEVHFAGAEVGQGATDVVELVARTELPGAEILLAPAGTAGVDSSGSSSASRLTYMACGAVQLACRAARAELARRGEALRPGEEIDVERVYRHRPTSPIDPKSGRVQGERVFAALAAVAMKAEVEVDVELGLSRVTWIGCTVDAGRVVNPLALAGQVHGGTAQGIGLALMEEIQVRDGVIRNPSFTDYLIPTLLDVPPAFDVDVLELPEPDAPYGVKGDGETPTVVATAAVAAALRDATGHELRRVPVPLDDLAGL